MGTDSTKDLECLGDCIDCGVWHDVAMDKTIAEMAPSVAQQCRYQRMSFLLATYGSLRLPVLLPGLTLLVLWPITTAGQRNSRSSTPSCLYVGATASLLLSML